MVLVAVAIFGGLLLEPLLWLVLVAGALALVLALARRGGSAA